MGSDVEILVVEDEFLLRMDLADSLRREGYVVHEASHAGEAVVVLESRAGIRAVITDVEMPGSGMDGLALAATIYKRWPPCKLIVVSGRVAPDISALPTGAHFIPKPYAFELILEKLVSWDIAA